MADLIVPYRYVPPEDFEAWTDFDGEPPARYIIRLRDRESLPVTYQGDHDLSPEQFRAEFARLVGDPVDADEETPL
jgi:hypothetical protein